MPNVVVETKQFPSANTLEYHEGPSRRRVFAERTALCGRDSPLLRQSGVLRTAKELQAELGAIEWCWHPKQTSRKGKARPRSAKKSIDVAAEVTTPGKLEGI
jgi:hypothetical protein